MALVGASGRAKLRADPRHNPGWRSQMANVPKTISIVSPCYDEQDNVRELYERTRAVMAQFPNYCYEHIFIDNASRDCTVRILKEIAARDPHVKIIVNARNFGHVRSPMHAILQAQGDAVAVLLSDLQDPPELLADMIREWEKGTPVVVAIKKTSDESGLMFRIRTAYYRLVSRLTDVRVFPHFTGFGLYDRQVIEIIRRNFRDPYPYFRGMIAEIGLPHVEIEYSQKRRARGITKNNFYTLYDLAMLGITNLSKVPLRLVTFGGFVSALLSLTSGLFYLAYKLIFWKSFSAGMAPVLLGFFFLGSLQMLSLGIIGEYVGSLHTLVQNRPLVVEKERVNFDVVVRRSDSRVTVRDWIREESKIPAR
jgi:glycosyltransferase involved in cell wall biosynthesis